MKYSCSISSVCVKPFSWLLRVGRIKGWVRKRERRKVRDAEGQIEVGRRREEVEEEEGESLELQCFLATKQQQEAGIHFISASCVSPFSPLCYGCLLSSLLLSLHWSQKRRRREPVRVERNSIAIQTAGRDRGAPGERRGWRRGGRKREEDWAGEETDQGNDLGWGRREGQSSSRGQTKREGKTREKEIGKIMKDRKNF